GNSAGGPPGAEGVAYYPGRNVPLQGHTWRVVVDNRTRALIVRATEKNVQMVADLVAVLDLPPDKPVPKVKSLKAFKLHHAKAEAMLQTLQQLGTRARLAADAASNTLIAAGPDDDLKEIGDVIEALDVEVKTAPGEKPKGPLPGSEPAADARLIRLRYVPATHMMDILQKVGTGAVLRPDPTTNSVMVRGSDAEIRQIEQIIKAIDVPARAPGGKGGGVPTGGTD